MGQKAPKPAKPTPAETALQEEQVSLLRQQKAMIEEQTRQQNLIAPFLYKQAGIKPLYGNAEDPSQITGFEEGSTDPEAAQIQQLLQQRTLAALQGQLPVDAGLLNELDTQEKQLNERLFKSLGPGYETSTPGIEALSQFGKQKSAMLDAARRGDITLGESLGLARENATQNNIGDLLSRGAGISNLGAGSIGQLFGVGQGYSNVLQNMRANRALQLQYPGMSAGPAIGSTVGTLLGTVVGGYFGGPMGASAGGSAGGALGGTLGGIGGTYRY